LKEAGLIVKFVVQGLAELLRLAVKVPSAMQASPMGAQLRLPAWAQGQAPAR